jgi:hypothetical protein
MTAGAERAIAEIVEQSRAARSNQTESSD